MFRLRELLPNVVYVDDVLFVAPADAKPPVVSSLSLPLSNVNPFLMPVDETQYYFIEL